MADELVKKRITEYGTEVTPDDLDNSDVIFVDSTQHGTRKLRLKGIRDIISGIQNEAIKSSGVSVTADNYATTITNVNNQPVNTIYAYAAGLQSNIANLPSNNVLNIMHYTYKYSVATNVGQVQIAIERSGEKPAMYFRTTSGTPVTWGNWVKMANNADIEAIREELDNLDIETDKTLSISGKPADAKATGDAIDDLKADLSEIVNGGYLIEKSDIVQGSYDGNGNITTSSIRIRPSQFIPVTNGGTVQFTPGDNVKQIFYGKFDTNKTFLGDGPSWFSSNFTTDWDGYMLCVYRNGTNTDIVPVDYDAVTLVMTPKEYENYNKNKEQNLFFVAAQDTIEIKDYTNIITPIFTEQSVDTANGSPTISNVVNVEVGKTYFGYALVNITDLNGYTTGYMYLRAWNSLVFTLDGKIAGNNNQHIANGEIELYGEFTPTSSGTVKMMLYHANSGNAYTYNVTVEKLYLIEGTSEALKTIRSKEYDKDLVTSELYDDSVGLKKLSSEVRSIIGTIDTNVIDCWGDSLTVGAGGSGTTYPSKLHELIGEAFTVNNYGQGSESAESIAFRQGGLDGIVKPFTASTDYVTVPALQSVDGSSLGTLNLQGTYYGNNIVSIDGINYFYRRVSETECKLARISGSSNPTYTRPMLVTSEGKGTKHIIIICVGQNGWVNTNSETLADIIQRMIEHNGYDKYLVLGIPTGNYESKHEQEVVLSSRFGSHFVNTREYISAYGLSDNSLTATADDETAMHDGAIPPSLRVDGVHMNNYGYIAMANCVYARGKSLGYWH